MSPTRRIATILTIATVTLAGAGFALASVGGTTATNAEAAAPAASSEVTTDPAVVRILTRQLSQLDSRSNKLRKLLEGIRGKSQQVSKQTVVARNESSGYNSAPAPAPAPATTQGSDDGYQDDSEDAGDDNESADDNESESESNDD